MSKLTIECDVGNVSDGYHTFNELYAHRTMLFIALMIAHPKISWKSKCHHDGTYFNNWFIAGMDLPTGTITYHLSDLYWTMTKAKELEHAPEWDGHTSNDVLTRLSEWIKSS